MVPYGRDAIDLISETQRRILLADWLRLELRPWGIPGADRIEVWASIDISGLSVKEAARRLSTALIDELIRTCDFLDKPVFDHSEYAIGPVLPRAHAEGSSVLVVDAFFEFAGRRFRANRPSRRARQLTSASLIQAAL